MNTLRVHTQPAASGDAFRVHWTNSDIRLCGLLEVTVGQDVPDKPILAELAALRHLLEVKQVLGDKLVGTPGTRLIVSLGAIRKLKLRHSDKAHLAPHAVFLATRFAGCRLEVSKETGWFAGRTPEAVESLSVGRAPTETLRLTGVGEVAVTRHVLDRLAARLPTPADPDRAAPAVWKKLKQLASDPLIREVARDSLWAGVLHGNREGRYFLNTAHNLVLVVTDQPGEGRRLVTAYPASHRYKPTSVPATTRT